MEKQFVIEGMHCEKCSARLQKALSSMVGVSSACVDFRTKQAHVVYDEKLVSVSQLESKVDSSGFSVFKK